MVIYHMSIVKCLISFSTQLGDVFEKNPINKQENQVSSNF